MIDLEQIHDSIASTPSKIVLLVADGLGGLPHPDTRKSELETAHIPNLNGLAQRSPDSLAVPTYLPNSWSTRPSLLSRRAMRNDRKRETRS